MHSQLQETLRILLITPSIEESDFFLNLLKEKGYNSRGTHIESLEKLDSSLDESYNWHLVVIEDNIANISIDQVLTAISKRQLYIPVILISNANTNMQYSMLQEGVRAILPKKYQNYFTELAIKEINDFNIRKNYLLMSLALNSIENHSRMLMNKENSAIVYISKCVIEEANNEFISMLECKKNDSIIGKSMLDFIDDNELEYFNSFIRHIETAAEPVSVMQTLLSVNKKAVPVNIVILPTSLNGKFVLCLQINKSSKIDKNKKRLQFNSTTNRETSLISFDKFKQQLNISIQRALSDNEYSILSCINLGKLYKLLKNDYSAVVDKTLSNITKLIQELLLDKTLITNLDNGYFILLYNSNNKKDIEQNIISIINKLNTTDVTVNDNNLKVDAFAGMSVISPDINSPQELLKNVKHASVVAYMQKMTKPNLYTLSNKNKEQNIDQALLKSFVNKISEQKIQYYYQGLLNTKGKPFRIYDSYACVKVNQTVFRDTELELKLSTEEIWEDFDRLKITNIVAQLKENINNIDKIIVTIGIKSIQNNKFSEWLDNLLIKNQIDSSYLIIEINEYFAIKHATCVQKFFIQLQNKGYKTSIGNFGCSLEFNKAINILKPNFVRIDKSFLEESKLENPKNLVQILEVVKDFNIKAIIAHIDDLATMQKILELDAHLLLGNYIQPKSEHISLLIADS